MHVIKLRDQLGITRSFTGDWITGFSTREDEQDKPRWVEMELYQHNEGGYVLFRNGKSVIFHRHPNTCGRDGERAGVKTDAGKLRDTGMRPCRTCLKQRTLVADHYDFYDAETDRPIVTRCQLPEDVIAALTEERAPSREPYLSKPAQRLLERAAEKDPGIREAWTQMEIPI